MGSKKRYLHIVHAAEAEAKSDLDEMIANYREKYGHSETASAFLEEVERFRMVDKTRIADAILKEVVGIDEIVERNFRPKE